MNENWNLQNKNDGFWGDLFLAFIIIAISVIFFPVSLGVYLSKKTSIRRFVILGFSFFLLVLYIGIPPFLNGFIVNSKIFFNNTNPEATIYNAPPLLFYGKIEGLEKSIRDDLKEIAEVKGSNDYTKEYKSRSVKKLESDIRLKERFKREAEESYRKSILPLDPIVKESNTDYMNKYPWRLYRHYLVFLFLYFVGFLFGRFSYFEKSFFKETCFLVGLIFSIPGEFFSKLFFYFFPEEGFYSNADSSENSDVDFEGSCFGSNWGFFTDKNLSLHTQVIGGSGSGKTNFLKVFMSDRIRRGDGVIFLDFKADFEVLDWMKNTCSFYERKDLRVLSLSSPSESLPYNPIESGNATEITSQLMNSFEWSESFYKNYAENCLLMILNILCYLRDETGEKFHLGHVLDVLTSGETRRILLDRGKNYRFISQVRSVFLELDGKKVENLSGLVSQLRKIIFSSVGDIFTVACENSYSLSLKDSIMNGDIVYLYMNSMSLKEVAGYSGKMILQDLMKVAGQLYGDTAKSRISCHVIIDEFASFATPDFISFLDKARGAGISIMIAHQSMSDLRDISDSFANRVYENTASKLIFNVQNSEDAEMYASTIGTFETEERTAQTEESYSIFGLNKSRTGMGTIKIVEKFKIHPNSFKELGQGEAVVISTKVDPHFGFTFIDKAQDVERFDDVFSLSSEGLEKSKYMNISMSSEKNNLMNITDIDSI